MANDNPIEIFTDGACRGNPGPGGWGVWLCDSSRQQTLCGGELATTNNRMELLAAIKALASVPQSRDIILTTDSQYLRLGITEWLPKWKLKNWKTAANKPVKNQDLWQQLDEQVQRHQIRWHWVKGHTGHPGNEKADSLANQGLDELLRECQ